MLAKVKSECFFLSAQYFAMGQFFQIRNLECFSLCKGIPEHIHLLVAIFLILFLKLIHFILDDVEKLGTPESHPIKTSSFSKTLEHFLIDLSRFDSSAKLNKRGEFSNIIPYTQDKVYCCITDVFNAGQTKPDFVIHHSERFLAL